MKDSPVAHTNNSPAPLTFRKTAACPASSTLVSYRTEKLSREIAALVRKHLVGCEFCNAELRLLAHHKPRAGRIPQTPEIPMNLRILAESILGK
jgi:hypothetical protein